MFQSTGEQSPALKRPPGTTESSDSLHAEDAGYHKGLKPRPVQMIAIGGAIGTGLFLGAGGQLDSAAPALVLNFES
jgi:L-asparagine permease